MISLNKPLKTLIVDDTKTSRAMLRQALQTLSRKFIFFEAGDGLEAVEIYRKERPELLFIDLEMPRRNGLETVVEIRKMHPSVDIIVVSSNINDVITNYLSDLKVNGVINKPFNLSVIAKVLGISETAPPKAAGVARKPNILIADDSRTIREVLTSICKSKVPDATVTTVDDGEKAVIEVRMHEYDLVFLDVNMPKIDGLQALPLIKRIRPKTQVIMLTADRSEATIRAAAAAGASGYVAKPFEMEQIHRCFEKLK